MQIIENYKKWCSEFELQEMPVIVFKYEWTVGLVSDKYVWVSKMKWEPESHLQWRLSPASLRSPDEQVEMQRQ